VIDENDKRLALQWLKSQDALDWAKRLRKKNPLLASRIQEAARIGQVSRELRLEIAEALQTIK
jgi:hypothetical protein